MAKVVPRPQLPAWCGNVRLQIPLFVASLEQSGHPQRGLEPLSRLTPHAEGQTPARRVMAECFRVRVHPPPSQAAGAWQARHG